MVSTHASQFRSNLSVTPKLTPIMIANVRIDLYSPNGWCIKFPFCPPNKGYKYLCIPSVSTFPVAPPCLPSRSRTHRPRHHLRNRSTPLGFEDSSSRIICSNNGDHLQNPRGTFTPSICAFTFHSSSNFLFASLISAFPLKNLRSNVVIPLENQPSMVCLGPMGNPYPTTIINLETSWIPFKSSNMNLDWSQAFRSFPSVTPGWRNWFRRVATA